MNKNVVKDKNKIILVMGADEWTEMIFDGN
jgi:hypothetical protein